MLFFLHFRWREQTRNICDPGDLQALKDSVSELTRNNDRLHRETSFTDKLSNAYAQIDGIKNSENQSEPQFEKNSWHDFRNRTEDALGKLHKWEHRLLDVARSVSIHDMKHRRCNIIIDHLSENVNENTVDQVNEILDLVLDPQIREKVKKAKAYRLGRKKSG